MGSELSCPCDSVIKETEETPNNPNEEVNKIIQLRLTQDDIIFQYHYETTKICVIKTINLEKFFKTRSVLKLTNNKEVNDYFDKIFIANYLGKKDVVVIILQCTAPSRLSVGSFTKKTSKKIKQADYSAKYLVDDLMLFSTDPYKNAEILMNDLNNKLKKNLIFQGQASDADNTNKTYKILYKGSLQNKNSLEYSIDLYEGVLEEKKMEEFLNSRVNKRAILKSVLVDTACETPSKAINASSSFTSNNKIQTLYFIFEDNPVDMFQYEYNVIKMKRENSNKDSYMKDITSKLNDYQQFFTLTTFITDENAIYLFMVMPTEMFTIDEGLTPY